MCAELLVCRSTNVIAKGAYGLVAKIFSAVSTQCNCA